VALEVAGSTPAGHPKTCEAVTFDPRVQSPGNGETRRWLDCRTMSNDRWEAVDAYTTSLLQHDDPVLDAALADSAILPNIAVSAAQGQFLHLMARAIHARRILEIGTLGGYSAIWMGRALPEGGRLISLELDERHAQVARGNIARAGLADKVEVRVGAALDSLAKLKADGTDAFDLVFIDADKRNTPAYFSNAIDLAHTGSLIVVDNVVRDGKLIDTDSDDPDAAGMRLVLENMGKDPRILPASIQTVGVKGWDGFAFALVVEP
jgi:predicted O-methyltransferase YrrM